MAFGITARHDDDAPILPHDRFSCVYDGDRLVAMARARPFAQWFGRRAVPCGGVSSVMIATDHRGRGLARAVMAHALDAMAERGEPISSLFPTTATLYRSLGYEIGGTYRVQRVPIAELPASDGSLTWEPAAFDAVEVRSVANRAGIDHDGWLVRGEVDYAWLEHNRRHRATSGDVFVGRRDGAPVAAAAVSYTSTPTDEVFELTADLVTGVDHHALGEALAFLARHGTAAGQADVKLPTHVLVADLAHPQRLGHVWGKPWMTRIVDVPGALAARGWSPVVGTTIDLEITDDGRTGNAGRWRLTITEGTATVEAGGDGTATLDIRDLASWYTGATPATGLARRGHLTTDDDGLPAVMDAIVSGGEPPTTIDFF